MSASRRAVWIPVVLLLVWTGTPGARRADVALRFVDVAAEAGVTLRNVSGGPAKDYIVELNGNGAAFVDYDRDDDLDLLVVNGSTLDGLAGGGDPMVALYENDGRGRYADVTAGRGLDARGWGMGTCAADVDNDGFTDVYVTAFGPNVLYRNRGDGTFADVTAAAGVGEAHWGSNCAFGDYDRDGHVDLYVANYLVFDLARVPARGATPDCRYQGIPVACGPIGLPPAPDVLYRNDGDGTFTDVTAVAGVGGFEYYGFGVLFTDLDDDGWPDLYVANDSHPNLLFINQGDGTFVEEGLVAGVALSATAREQAGMGVDAGDYDGDGRLDLIVTNFSGDYNTLYQNSEAGFFNDVTATAGLVQPTLASLGWGVGFVDADNDGWLDLLVANGHVVPELDAQAGETTYRQPNQLFRNQGDGRFVEATAPAGDGLRVAESSRGAAFGDYDNDGDVDAFIVNLNARPTLLRNDTDGDHHWITLRLVGTESNRDAIGAKVSVETDGRTQVFEVRGGGSYLSHHDLRVHVGLGHADRVSRLEIRWPSGRVETVPVEGLAVDTFHLVREGEGVARLR